MSRTNKIFIVLFIALFFLTIFYQRYTVEKMNTPIYGFDWMKVSHDNVGNQKSKTFFTNLANIVKTNFPGATHIAISTPMNSQTEFLANVAAGTVGAVKPAPLSIESFIDMQLDVIHSAGFNAVIRSIPCQAQGGIDGFDTKAQTSDYWVAYNKSFLDAHKAHIQNGDIIALWYEGDRTDMPAVINDTGNRTVDENTFLRKNASMINTWATVNNLTNIRVRTVMGVADSASIAAQGAIVHDHYGTLGHLPLQTDAFYLNELKTQITSDYTAQGGKYPVYEQEWGDIRNSTPNGSIQQTDPSFTGQMADQVFFPLIKQGIMEGVDFWDLFDTPKEGIVTISGDTVVINQKGIELSKIFKKWFGGVTPTPIPTPIPTPTPTPVSVIPAFTITKSAKIDSDGKGGLTITLS